MPDVYAIFLHPRTFTARSGFVPFIEAVNAKPVCYDVAWSRLQARSWTMGHAMRRFGNWYYGSEWNMLVPWVDERRFARAVAPGHGIVHFLWGEFASPLRPGLFRSKGHRVAGTFHCSARRQPEVLGRSRCIGSFDRLSMVSRTQIPFFVQHGFPEQRISFLPLGVDTSYFRPPIDDHRPSEEPLNAILVGKTERDHEFAAAVMKTAPLGCVRLTVCTDVEYHKCYAGLANVDIAPRLPDEQLLALYQGADLMIMPMLDCTANDAMLECMACGTPVMANGVGGIPEYVDPSCNFVTEGKSLAEWTSLLVDLSHHRDELETRRPAVRAWAEKFDWHAVAPQYLAFYEQMLVE